MESAILSKWTSTLYVYLWMSDVNFIFNTFAEVIGFNANSVDHDQIPLHLFCPDIVMGTKTNIGL